MLEQGRALRAVVAIAVTLLAVAGPGRAQAPVLACQGAQKPQQVADLLFGRKIGGQGIVGEGAWRRFVAREITPRFPDGLTILGPAWRDLTPNGLCVSQHRGDDRDAWSAEDYDRLNQTPAYSASSGSSPLGSLSARPVCRSRASAWCRTTRFAGLRPPSNTPDSKKRQECSPWSRSNSSPRQGRSTLFPPIAGRGGQVADVHWRPREKRLVVGGPLRLDGRIRVDARAAPLLGASLERVLACKCKCVNPAAKDAVLNLLPSIRRATRRPAWH